MITVGSLFTGIGGIDLGLERAGMKVIWQIEQDMYAQKVLAKNFPGVPCYSDVRTAHPPYADVLAGGFPCQDISVAGKRIGLAGTRSGLWKEFLRIIRSIRPKYVLVENVPALRSSGLGEVLRDLASSGYDAEWDCIPASAFGAPHRRDRIFIIAYSNSLARRRLQSKCFSRCEGSAVVGDDGKEIIVARPKKHTAWATEPEVGRVVDGVPSRVDRLRCLGNAVVPQVAEFLGRLILEAHSRD